MGTKCHLYRTLEITVSLSHTKNGTWCNPSEVVLLTCCCLRRVQLACHNNTLWSQNYLRAHIYSSSVTNLRQCFPSCLLVQSRIEQRFSSRAGGLVGLMPPAFGDLGDLDAFPRTLDWRVCSLTSATLLTRSGVRWNHPPHWDSPAGHGRYFNPTRTGLRTMQILHLDCKWIPDGDLD